MNYGTGCEFRDDGDKRIYSFSDSSIVVENPKYPGKARYQFFDSRNRTLRDQAVTASMKKSVENFKRMRGIK